MAKALEFGGKSRLITTVHFLRAEERKRESTKEGGRENPLASHPVRLTRQANLTLALDSLSLLSSLGSFSPPLARSFAAFLPSQGSDLLSSLAPCPLPRNFPRP